MTTVHRVTAGLGGWCHPVPPDGAGACEVCRGYAPIGRHRCGSCAAVCFSVSAPCETVVPFSLVTRTSPLYASLRLYKGAPSPGSRKWNTVRVVALLARFLYDHGSCIEARAGTAWDYMTTVPSTLRPAPHALCRGIERVPWLSARHRTTLVRGEGHLAHRRASDYGFRTVRTVAGDRVLLVDDIWTSGARAQSAASALHIAGATVVAVVPVARYVNAGPGVAAEPFWRRWAAEQVDLTTCCLCAAAVRSRLSS